MESLKKIFIICALLAGTASANVTIDPDAAKLACEKQDYKACLRLAVYFEKLGKVDQAKSYREIVCQAGDLPSCRMLAEQFVKKADTKQALKWYRLACNNPQDQGESCYAIAELAMQSGSEVNAKIWYEKACSAGHDLSCTKKEHSADPKRK